MLTASSLTLLSGSLHYSWEWTIQLATELWPLLWPLLFLLLLVGHYRCEAQEVRLWNQYAWEEIHASLVCVCVCMCAGQCACRFLTSSKAVWPWPVSRCFLQMEVMIHKSQVQKLSTHTYYLTLSLSSLWNQYYHYPLLETKKPRHRKVKETCSGHSS